MSYKFWANFRTDKVNMSFYIAWRYLRGTRGFVSVMTFFSFFGLVLGVSALIVVTSVMNGFHKELTKKFLGLNGHVTAQSRWTKEHIHIITQTFPDVRVVPFVSQQGIVLHQGNHHGIMVRGMHTTDLHQRLTLCQGNFKGLVLGQALAKKFHIKRNDMVSLMLPQWRPVGFGLVPVIKKFQVTGLFHTGMQDYDMFYAFLPLKQAQNFFAIGDTTYTGCEFFLPQPEKCEDISYKLRKTYPLAYVYSWKDMNGTFLSALMMEKWVMSLILALIILIAAFNVVSSLMMIVYQKIASLSILQTMGMTRAQVRGIFLYMGAMIGLAGSTLGLAIGLLLSHYIDALRRWVESFWGTSLFSSEVYMLTHVPCSIQWWDVTLILGLSFFISVLAGLYPAWRAQKISLVEGVEGQGF